MPAPAEQRVPVGMLSRASSLVYGRSHRPASVSRGLGRSTAGARGSPRTKRILLLQEIGTKHVTCSVGPKLHGADNEDLYLPFACVRSCRFGGSTLDDVLAVGRGRRDYCEPPLLNGEGGGPILREAHVTIRLWCGECAIFGLDMGDRSVLVGGFALAGLVLFLTYPVAT
jgi:hypothetical protein